MKLFDDKKILAQVKTFAKDYYISLDSSQCVDDFMAKVYALAVVDTLIKEGYEIIKKGDDNGSK